MDLWKKSLLCLQVIVFALPLGADTSSSLTSEEALSLQLMREKEKLAHPVS